MGSEHHTVPTASAKSIPKTVKLTNMLREQKEAVQEQPQIEKKVEGSTKNPPQQKKVRFAKMRRLIREYGIAFAIWTIVFDEILWAILTALLHFKCLGSIDAPYLIQLVGAHYDFDGSSYKVFDYELSTRLLANMGAAEAVIWVATPLTFPLCLATLPAFRKVTTPLARPFKKRFNAWKDSGKAKKPSQSKSTESPAASSTSSRGFSGLALRWFLIFLRFFWY